MGTTLPLLFENQESLNKFMTTNGFVGKQTKDGLQYIIREKNESINRES